MGGVVTGPIVGSANRSAPIAIKTAAVATWFASAATDNGEAPFPSVLYRKSAERIETGGGYI